ncbi:hypothetical protein CROQUDRAFT_83481 [Cronartium quercuum f. sp. fusiforme G11]|uniref:RRM domain-containing protein n=1 Tax=Cronartium quercuum f. sp. fusiforme G11 TaxID=708437 RepID=A0A9P6NBZ0_9BASI|nr:hypothetical protein CROQUDRAFT_83481 [Cronartium quercuum f. sp. fusiforme G11]
MLADRAHRHDSLQLRTSGRAGSELRLSSSTFRSRPYPTAGPNRFSYHQPPPGNPDGKWSHDLFEEDSDIYEPKIRFKADLTFPPRPSEPRPSPSLRPFGKSQVMGSNTSPSVGSRLFASTGLVNASDSASQTVSDSPAPVPAVVPSQVPRTNISLLSRIQSASRPAPFCQPIELLSNSSITSTFASVPAVRAEPAPSELREARELQEQKARLAKAQKAYELAINKYMSGPVILEVSNLADGTSAEDVKTAFADFGEIQDCSTEEGPKQGFQPTLKARMVFVQQADAEKAVEALNGVLADGLVLGVRIVSKFGKKPERADFQHASPLPLATPPSVIPIAATDSVMTIKNDVEMKPATEDGVMGVEPIVPVQSSTGKLRSELLAHCDPRATLQSEPQPPSLYKSALASSLLTNRVEPAAPSSATDDLMRSIGISTDAMKLMQRLQVVEPSLATRTGGRGVSSGFGGRSRGGSGKGSGGGGGRTAVTSGGNPSSLLARMERH